MSPQQCRAARALLGLSRPQLSLLSRVGKNTIQAFEVGKHNTNPSTVSRLRSAFASLSVSFAEDAGGVSVHRNSRIDGAEGRLEPAEPVRDDIASEGASLSITPAQARAARAFLDISQAEAAAMADVGLSLIVAFETGIRTPRLSNLNKIRTMYERRGIKFATVDGVPAVQAMPREEPPATAQNQSRCAAA